MKHYIFRKRHEPHFFYLVRITWNGMLPWLVGAIFGFSIMAIIAGSL